LAKETFQGAKGGALKLADRIRDHVQHRYVDPARQRGAESFTVVAGEVHRDMKLANRMPAVCGALRSKALQSGCRVSLVRWSGPDQGSTAEATFKLLAVPDDSAVVPSDGLLDVREGPPRVRNHRITPAEVKKAHEVFEANEPLT